MINLNQKKIEEKLTAAIEFLKFDVRTENVDFGFYHQGYFDYDPITNQGFFDLFIPQVKDKVFHVHYLDFNQKEISKDICLDRETFFDKDCWHSIRLNHSELYSCAVEGSYLLFGESRAWYVFYDAEQDFGILGSGQNELISKMQDFLV